MPAIKHAINHVRDIKEILEFEKNGVKNLSTIAAVLESESGEADPDAWNLKEIDSDATRLTISDVQSGSIPVLKKGEKLSPFTHDKPSPTFQGFLEFLIREFSVGIGLPYEFLWHTAGITGPAQRFIMGKAQRRFQERQRLFDQLMRKTWAMVISDAVSQKKLPVVDDWYKCRIQAPAHITIDAGREMNQEREDVKAGLMTLREHFGRRGLDWQSECQQKGKELKYIIEKSQAIAEESGLEMQQVLNLMTQGELGQIATNIENERNTEDQAESSE
jgi:capsid protein